MIINSAADAILKFNHKIIKTSNIYKRKEMEDVESLQINILIPGKDKT